MKFLVAALVLSSLAADARAGQGAATFGCDKEYPKRSKAFDKAYHSGKFQQAYDALETYLAECDWIKDRRAYWIWSDLSLAAYKMGDAEKCLSAVRAAEDFQRDYGPEKYRGDKRLSEKMTPAPAALNALLHNKKLCEELAKSQKAATSR